MKNKDYHLLLVGNFESVYVIQFVKHLKKINPSAHISFWGYKRETREEDRSFQDCYDEYCFFDMKHLVHSSPLWQIKAIEKLKHSFEAFVSGKHFDFISIHYIKPEYVFLVDYFKKSTSHLVLTPWGSDVYRINRLYKFLLKRIFDNADYITGPDDRFTRDFTKIFSIPEEKIVHCDLGVAPIDYIIEYKNKIGVNEAKQQLGIGDSYVITCGYNASSAHLHHEIIDAVYKIKDKLPKNFILLFPLTYPDNPEYKKSIREKVEEYGLKAIYFEEFLEIPQLFLVRQATDLFIHIQTTDASSGTLYEYLLCEKKILNGAWLQYPEIEKDGKKPYFLVNNIEHLDQAIMNAYQSEPITIDKQVLTDLEKKQWKVVIKDWDKFFTEKA